MKKGYFQNEVPLGESSNFMTARNKDSVIVNSNTGSPVMYVHEAKKNKQKNKTKTARKADTETKREEPFSNEEDESERQGTIVRSELPPAAETKQVERVEGRKPIPLPTVVHHHYHHHYHNSDDGFPDREAESELEAPHPSDHTKNGQILKDDRTKIPVMEIRKIVSEHPNTDSIRIRSQGEDKAPVAEIEESAKSAESEKKALISNLDSFEKKTDILNDLAGDVRKAAADKRAKIDEKL